MAGMGADSPLWRLLFFGLHLLTPLKSVAIFCLFSPWVFLWSAQGFLPGDWVFLVPGQGQVTQPIGDKTSLGGVLILGNERKELEEVAGTVIAIKALSVPVGSQDAFGFLPSEDVAEAATAHLNWSAWEPKT